MEYKKTQVRSSDGKNILALTHTLKNLLAHYGYQTKLTPWLPEIILFSFNIQLAKSSCVELQFFVVETMRDGLLQILFLCGILAIGVSIPSEVGLFSL